MNLAQIKQAIEEGQKVKWKNALYDVIKDSNGEYIIVCSSNKYLIGLIWEDGTTINGKEKDFYIDTPINIGSKVKYAKPFADEVNTTYTVIEIEQSTNWCKIEANVGMNLKPTYTANLSDLQLC